MALAASSSERFLICSGTDITDERAAMDRLQTAANTDILTGVRNRFHLMRFLDEQLARPENAERLAVVYVNLNNFKMVNDTIGHEAGDQLLKKVAQRLAALVDQSDHLSRARDDKFVIVSLGDQATESAQRMAERILVEFEASFTFRLSSYRLAVSVGTATHQEGTEGAHGLLIRADMAMHAAKDAGRSSGRSRYKRYTPEM